MCRVARHLFTMLSVMSLLLCVAVCVLWVRSYALTDQVICRHVGGQRSVLCSQGYVVVRLVPAEDWWPAQDYVLRYARDKASSPVVGYPLAFVNVGDTSVHWEWGGFVWEAWRLRDKRRLYATGVAPFWSIALATAALPLWTAVRLRSRVRERRRKSVGLCPTCGYDLRATPDRCPECGQSNDAVQKRGGSGQ